MKFIYLPTFVKRLKELSKKYPSLRDDFSSLLKKLEINPRTGTDLGKDCYKIRLAIKSKGRGKSGGALPVSKFKWILFISLLFMTRPIWILFQIAN